MELPLKGEFDHPDSLKGDLIEIRNLALSQGDFHTAVLLSHVHAWLDFAGQIVDLAADPIEVLTQGKQAYRYTAPDRKTYLIKPSYAIDEVTPLIIELESQ